MGQRYTKKARQQANNDARWLKVVTDPFIFIFPHTSTKTIYQDAFAHLIIFTKAVILTKLILNFLPLNSPLDISFD